MTTTLIIIPKAYVYKLKMNNFPSLGGEEGPRRGREKPMISPACVVYINLKALIFWFGSEGVLKKGANKSTTP